MKKALVLCLVALFAVSVLGTVASAKKVDRQQYRYESLPAETPLPPDLAGQVGALRSAAAADTFLLLEEDFDDSAGDIGNLPGWSTADITAQIGIFWHVADATELNGGIYGSLIPLNGAKSMWCGVSPATTVPTCGYVALPGYASNWDQWLVSASTPGDSVQLSYNVFWDSEPGWDGSTVDYTFDDGTTWYSFPITDSLSARAGHYDAYPPAEFLPYISETVTNQVPGTPGGNVKVRFRFESDGNTDGSDGYYASDGGITIDNLQMITYADGSEIFNNLQDFEGAAVGATQVGIWTAINPPAFGDYASLYPGVNVVQEDPCVFNALFMWGFFDDPAVTAYDCHTPDPLPGQGAMPYVSADGLYMNNEVWTPPFNNIGSGTEYRVRFQTYRDLPLDNLQFYSWRVRSWNDPDGGGPQPLCPGPWRTNFYVYFGGQRDWITSTFQVGAYVDPSADALSVALAGRDMCVYWCQIYGTGACHSHCPLIDDLRVERIATFGPQYVMREIEAFQDNFSGDGTLTGTARADIANDVLPNASPGIMPGDSTAMTIAPVALVNNGPSAWIYTRVVHDDDPKSGAGLGSQDTRTGKAGPRWPYIGSWVDANTNTWYIFQMDSAFSAGGTGNAQPDVYCVDLNDDYFVPGDTILYFFAADADVTLGNGNENFQHRPLNGQGYGPLDTWVVTPDIEEAAASPAEFEILPSGGYTRGGDILYVDDADDRGGPVQLYFDSAFDLLGIRHLVDRFDIQGPSSNVANSLASRVTNNITQIINVYRKIIWCTSNLSSGLVGDGTNNPEKSDDWSLLEQFIRTSTKGPGLYLSGDDMAEEWVTLQGAGAITFRSTWLPFNLQTNGGDHRALDEPISPTVWGTGGGWAPFSGQSLVAYGGCAAINDFDVITPTGVSTEEFAYPGSDNDGSGGPGDVVPGAGSAVISSQQTNAQGQTATVVLSGFAYNYIRDAVTAFPPARVTHLREILTYMGNIVPEATGITPEASPYVYSLGNAYPNPFNPTTTIKYSIKERGHVSLKVYNAAGQLIRTLVDEVQAPDQVQPMTWDGANNAGQTVSSGVYFYKLVSKNFSQTKKMVLLK